MLAGMYEGFFQKMLTVTPSLEMTPYIEFKNQLISPF